jgi:hypothetical protein
VGIETGSSIKLLMVTMGYVGMEMMVTMVYMGMVDTSSLWLMYMQHWSHKSRVTGVFC